MVQCVYHVFFLFSSIFFVVSLGFFSRCLFLSLPQEQTKYFSGTMNLNHGLLHWLHLAFEVACKRGQPRSPKHWLPKARVCLLVGCLTSQQHVSVSQRRICSDNFTCCHTETEVADPTFYLTQSQYTDTGATSPSADPITPGAWQGSHWNANFFKSLV